MELLRLKSAARATQRRLQFEAGLKGMARWLPTGVLFLTPWAISYRMGILSDIQFLAGCTLGGGVLLAAALRSASKGPGLLAATLQLDRTHELSGRLAAAMEFSGEFESRAARRGYEGLVLEDAAQLGELSPKRAAPLFLPRGILWGGAMLAVWSSLLLLPDPKLQPVATKSVVEPKEEDPRWVSEDDAELLQRASRDLETAVESDEAKNAAGRFNEIVLSVVSGEINQEEAFRLAAELQADINSATADAEEFHQGMDRRGQSLEKRKITQEIGKAMREQRYDDAEKALKKLAERLAAGTESLSQEELDDLREALEELRKQNEEEAKKKAEQSSSAASQNALQKRRDELQKKKKEGTASKKELSELKKAERELKRLGRNKEKQKASAQQELSELDKKLAEAARELQKEQKKSGEFLDQAGRQMSQAAGKKLSDKEKRELLKQIEEMKERLRRQNQDGEAKKRLREFQKRARGQSRQGQQGQQGKGRGQGKQGSGKMRLGPGGQPIPIPGMGDGQGQGQGQQGQGQQEGQAGGKEAGHGHDPNFAGDPSRLEDSGHQDVSAVAQDTGEGESASETIVTAAEEGFSSSSYEKLFREYRTVAEEVMERETVPPGRKAHVRRYFELIRPRGDSPSKGSAQEKK